MSDFESMSDAELGLYVERAREALDTYEAVDDRVRLTAWLLQLRMEQDWRVRLKAAGVELKACGASVEHALDEELHQAA